MNGNNINEDHRSLIMSEIMTPDKVNFHGNVHGGYILALLDRVAYACASRYSAKIIVTLSVDHVVFKEPIYVGELVICYAMVNYVGKTSMEIGIRVSSENLITQVSRHTNSCYLTMVAIDDKGKPTKIKPLAIHTPLQQRRYDEAIIRREARLKMDAMHKQRKS
jgi:acyl-CoA hydrolase